MSSVPPPPTVKFQVYHEGLEVALDVVKRGTSLPDYIKAKIAARNQESEDPFYAVNIGRLFKLYEEWKRALPTVHPFYAVKCNADPAILKVLASLGTGFDCASKNEIDTVLKLGVGPERIIYANPCKQISHVKFAASKRVDMMTFDSDGELDKLKEHFPEARLVLRFRVDDPDANCPLGAKFGCSIPQGKCLLHKAKDYGLNVIGVSFHVGSGCQSSSIYGTALTMSKELFQYGKDVGFNFTLLDIGGGFPGTKDSYPLFSEVSATINAFLTKFFHPETYPNLTVISEPGRYFATSLYAVVVNVLNKKEQTSSDGTKSFIYYVNDGIYGTFNFMAFNDYYSVTPILLKDSGTSQMYHSTVWGPTCDSVDKLCESMMSELNAGDWLYFDDKGAYSVAARTMFNGFGELSSFYYAYEDHFQEIMNVPKLF